MTQVWAFIVIHRLECYIIAAIMIDRLPAPRNSYSFYAWLFGCLHAFASNFERAGRGLKGGLATKAAQETVTDGGQTP